jgi:hypothetical protein
MSNMVTTPPRRCRRTRNKSRESRCRDFASCERALVGFAEIGDDVA